MLHHNDNRPRGTGRTIGHVVAIDDMHAGSAAGIAVATPSGRTVYLRVSLPADAALLDRMHASLDHGDMLDIDYATPARPRLGQPLGRIVAAAVVEMGSRQALAA